MKDSMEGVISPRGMVSVPSTSKRAMMRGLAGDILGFLLEGSSADMVFWVSVVGLYVGRLWSSSLAVGVFGER